MQEIRNLMKFDKDLEYIASKYAGKTKHIRKISSKYPFYCIHITNKKGLKKTEDYIYLSEQDLEYLR